MIPALPLGSLPAYIVEPPSLAMVPMVLVDPSAE